MYSINVLLVSMPAVYTTSYWQDILWSV